MPTNFLSTATWQTNGSRAAAAIAAVLLCLGLALATAPQAAAHDRIISSNPSPDAQLDAAPAGVELSFSGSLLILGNEVRVMDAADKDWAQGEPALSGTKLAQPVQANMPDGEYLVRWRVVSSDGHPINGTQTFVVGDAAAALKSPAAAPTLKSTPSKSAVAPSATSAPSAQNESPPAAATQNSDGAAGGSALGKVLVIGLGALVGLGAYLGFVFIARARENSKQAS
ncbi:MULTISPECIES: copper resistance CopC family protein [Micrococcaceae]|uniref:copper resistance CopC family protein n=1 Tax=Micrococcaceae TaxID=1268 RepID=UPI000CE499EF|nr:copper resistance CopC family protein [Arthrobacter sp. N199823]